LYRTVTLYTLSRSYSDDQIAEIKAWCNTILRELLGHRMPDELFADELNQIYRSVE